MRTFIILAFLISPAFAMDQDLENAHTACLGHFRYKVDKLTGLPTPDIEGYDAGWEDCARVVSAWQKAKKEEEDQNKKRLIEKVLPKLPQ